MKKTIAVLLALLLLMLAACAKQPQETPAAPELPRTEKRTAEIPVSEEPTDSGTSEPAIRIEPESPSVIPVECWCDYVNESGTYTDSLGNEWAYSYRVPMLTANSIGADQINKKIDAICTPILDEQHAMMEEGLSLFCPEIRYDAALNGDVVSILLEIRTDYEFIEYHAYNFSLSTGEDLDGKLLDALGRDEAAFIEAAMQVTEAKFYEMNGTVGDELYDAQHSKTMSADSFSRHMPMYLDVDGRLCIIAAVYTIVGGDYLLFPLAVD